MAGRGAQAACSDALGRAPRACYRAGSVHRAEIKFPLTSPRPRRPRPQPPPRARAPPRGRRELRDKIGRTALSTARLYNHASIVALLNHASIVALLNHASIMARLVARGAPE